MVFDHQLHPYVPEQCVAYCTTSLTYNNQIQCGAPSAITALLAGEPAIAQCIIKLEEAKQNCINNCNAQQ